MRNSFLFVTLTSLLISNLCYSQTEDKLKPPIAALPKGDLLKSGMSADTISKVLTLIKTNPPNDFRAIVVVRNGEIVVEEYFNTYWRETIHDIRSAGKSITSLLLGIAIDKGLIRNTEQSIYDFLPPPKGKIAKEGRPDIRIKHLLTMSSGLDASDEDGSLGATGNWLTEKDWVSFAMSLPKVFEPGSKFEYNDVCPMLIGAIIEKTSGKKLADFANENLFSPLGIREYYWYTSVGGQTGPMGNLYISAVDFAKIGVVVLNKGKWNGKKIVSEGWIFEMTKKRMDLDMAFASGYGYFWYTASKEVNGKKYEYTFASGNGGNVLIVVPAEGLVVALMSSAYGQGYGHQRSNNVFKYILSSLQIK